MSFDLSVLNAKRMSMESVVRSFVVPETFEQLTTNDHAYLIGPRGSGKTTLLKMLSCRFVALWEELDPDAALAATGNLGFTGVFLPTDSLWTTQTHPQSRSLAFACQLLSSIVDAMQFRVEVQGAVRDSRFPVSMGPSDEVALVKELSESWKVPVESYTLRSLLASLDRILLSVSSPTHRWAIARDPFLMATHGVRTFNRFVGQSEHRWCILIDELEIAPDEIVAHVKRAVRGGSSELILKVSMSPSDRFRSEDPLTSIGRPMPIHDFVPVHLLSQSAAAKRSFTQALWHQSLLHAGIEPVSIEASFGRSFQGSAREDGVVNPIREEFELALSWDRGFTRWFEERHLRLDQLDSMQYVDRSAMVRKVYPLLVFRNSFYKATESPAGWARRSRKKEFEPFSGAAQIVNALEGNPRWIKSAFRGMVDRASQLNGQVDAPMQYSALLDVARSFESFLRFLPTPDVSGRVVNDVSLMQFVDQIAQVMHRAHVGPFTADPPNSFIVDDRAASRFGPMIGLGLHSGGIVHLRRGSSEPILSDFNGERFRLTYLLAVRPQASFPMRLGRPLQLSRIISPEDFPPRARTDTEQLALPLGEA